MIQPFVSVQQTEGRVPARDDCGELKASCAPHWYVILHSTRCIVQIPQYKVRSRLHMVHSTLATRMFADFAKLKTRRCGTRSHSAATRRRLADTERFDVDTHGNMGTKETSNGVVDCSAKLHSGGSSSRTGSGGMSASTYTARA